MQGVVLAMLSVAVALITEDMTAGGDGGHRKIGRVAIRHADYLSTFECKVVRSNTAPSVVG